MSHNTAGQLTLLALSALGSSFPVMAQVAEPETTPPRDSSEWSELSPLPGVAAGRPVSWKLLLPNLISDQGHIWTFPQKLVQGQNWIVTTTVLATTAGLVALDPKAADSFRHTTGLQGFNSIFTGNATTLGTIVAPSSFYVVGLFRKDARMQGTALLAGEAVVDSEIVTTVLKGATRRMRPVDISGLKNMSDSWFESNGSAFRGTGSFPSGHSIAAFSIATIVARRYGNHRWVPYVAYGMAGLVGFSRLSLSAHFMSDVFMGGALGYSISRFTVLRQ